MERELRNYWVLSQSGRALQRDTPADPELKNIRDEIEAVQEVTEWDGLRAACTRYLRRDAERPPWRPEAVGL